MEDAGNSRSGPSDDSLLAAFAKVDKRRREEVVRQRRNNDLKKCIAESSSEAERTAATVDLFSCVRRRSKRQLSSEGDIGTFPRHGLFEIGSSESASDNVRHDDVSETSSMITDDISVAPSPTPPMQLQTKFDLTMHLDDQLSTLDDVLMPLGSSGNTDCDQQDEQNVSFALDIGFVKCWWGLSGRGIDHLEFIFIS